MAASKASSSLWVIDTQHTGIDDAMSASLAERLPGADRIRAYPHLLTRRRALLSHLLQRHACCALAKLHPDQVQIKRTLGGKPFAAVDPAAHCPNFNFNASHDGEYVVLAASTHFLTGVDVHKRRAADCSCEHLEAQLTAAQWAQAEAMSPDQRKIWVQAVFSIKEAYTKAVGVGLGEALDSIEFVPPLPSAWAEPAAPGKKLPWKGRVQHLTQGEFCNQGDQGEWCLELRWIDADHIVATAAGDVARAVDADGDFTSRLTRPGLCPSSVEEGSFGVPEQLGIFDLISPEELAACAPAIQQKPRTASPLGYELWAHSPDSEYAQDLEIAERCRQVSRAAIGPGARRRSMNTVDEDAATRATPRQRVAAGDVGHSNLDELGSFMCNNDK